MLLARHGQSSLAGRKSSPEEVGPQGSKHHDAPTCWLPGPARSWVTKVTRRTIVRVFGRTTPTSRVASQQIKNEIEGKKHRLPTTSREKLQERLAKLSGWVCADAQGRVPPSRGGAEGERSKPHRRLRSRPRRRPQSGNGKRSGGGGCVAATRRPRSSLLADKPRSATRPPASKIVAKAGRGAVEADCWSTPVLEGGVVVERM